MNRTKIEWTDYTWNPITGCKHGCWYCYAHKMFTRFHRSWEPTFHADRLKEPWEVSKPSKIFVCSVADIFAEWTEPEWRDAVLESIFDCPVKHTFQLLTKNPENVPDAILQVEYPDNVWIGATITDRNDQHLDAYMKYVNCGVRFLSFEPLLGEVHPDLSHIDWIIIGKLTGSKKVPLDKAWVQTLLDSARKRNIPVFIKNNVGWPEKIQEFPK